ncbi:MAG: DUF2384 domain-containing protein [Deltaproteobacteria bacterium]|nr:DUF2384 domain-containing protein [Deltaproteobacteria bacterium]
MLHARQSEPEQDRVLTKAVLSAAKRLGASNRDLARILGCSEATISRLSRGRTIEVGTKQGELALLFVRLFRALDAMVSGDEAAAQRWYAAPNRRLGGVPSELVKSVGGLVGTVDYLDAMRGTF